MEEAHLSRHGLPDAVPTLVDRPIEDPGEEVQDEVHGSDANQGPVTPFICEEYEYGLGTGFIAYVQSGLSSSW